MDKQATKVTNTYPDWWVAQARQKGWLWPEQTAMLYGLVLVAQSYCPRMCVVEVGTYQGKSTCALAAGCRDTNTRLITVDNYSQEGSDIEAARRVLMDLGLMQYVHLVVDDSSVLASGWTGGKIGLLFIDGDHSFEAVQSDWLSWRPHLAEGGLVAFHDYGRPGVLRALKEVEHNGCARIATVRSLVVYQRGGSNVRQEYDWASQKVLSAVGVS